MTRITWNNLLGGGPGISIGDLESAARRLHGMDRFTLKRRIVDNIRPINIPRRYPVTDDDNLFGIFPSE